jgi:anti-sigma factor RsiW
MTRPLMTCRELIEFLDRFVADELDDAQRGEFDRHLALCPPCVAYVQTYREAARLARAALSEPEGAVPEAVPDELIAAVLAARRRG